MGVAASTTRRDAETSCCDPVHKVANHGARPGSVFSPPELSKQAFATPEANANNITSKTTNAVLRLVRVSVKNFMVYACCCRLIVGSFVDEWIDLDQVNCACTQRGFHNGER